MVLMMRVLIMVMMWTGCLAKQAPPSTVVDRGDMTMTLTQISMETGLAEPAPDGLVGQLEDQFSNRGYSIQVLAVNELSEAFHRRRLPSGRAIEVVKATEGSGFVVLVESVARFYSQLQGQYRWEVDVVATALHTDRPDLVRTVEFNIPVFLRYQHQDESDALVSASPVIERRLQGLLDDLADLSEP